MRKRPIALIVCSLIFLLFPIQLYLRSTAKPVPWIDWVLYGILPLILVVGLIRVTRFAWYTLIGFVLLWGIHDLQDVYSRGASSWSVLLNIGIYLFSLTYFINPRIRHLYFDPKTRWWRIKARFETHNAAICKMRGEYRYPILRNISEGGCFLETPHPGVLADMVEVSIPLPIPLGVSAVQAQGEIRWVSDAPGRAGMGIQFVGLSEENIRAVKEFVRRGL